LRTKTTQAMMEEKKKKIPKTAPSRLLERDGTMTIEKDTLNSFRVYNYLMRISWQHFLLYAFATYIALNTVFTLFYIIGGGKGCLANFPTRSNVALDFLEIFFFSTQTFTTVGYGFMHPDCVSTNLIASVEAFTGFVFFAVVTGAFYTKFTKPTVALKLSHVAVFDNFQDQKAFKFMLANEFDNRVVDVEVTLDLIRLEAVEGRWKKRFYQMYLFRKRIPYLSVPWTVVHVIDEKSPLHGLTRANFEQENLEFFVQVKFFDESHSQYLFQEFSFFGSEEVKWGHKFVNIQRYTERGALKLTMKRFGKTVALEGFPEVL
jgi:inward rectifier potassium channel